MAKRRHKARPARFALVLVLAALVVAVLALEAGSSTASSSAAPTNTSRPTISGTAREGQRLTASTGSWSGTTPFTFAYQWRRCDKTGGSCSSISGATQRQYRLTSADVRNTIRVRVTAQKSPRSATATTGPTA